MTEKDFARDYKELFRVLDVLTGDSEVGDQGPIYRAARTEIANDPSVLPYLLFSALSARERQTPIGTSGPPSAADLEIIEYAERRVVPKTQTVLRLFGLKPDLTAATALAMTQAATQKHRTVSDVIRP